MQPVIEAKPVLASSAKGGVDDAMNRLARHTRLDPLQVSWADIGFFLTPALVVYGGFTAYPVVRTFYNSFHRILVHGDERFVGIDNYIELMRDDTFWKAVGNTLIWSTITPLADVTIGLLLALALYAGVPFQRILRVAWFTPVLISYVVVGIIWLWIYNYDWGAANLLLRSLGLGALAHSWLGDPATALWALMFVHVWKWSGFSMVVCLAALHALPREVIEAAELDNCGWLTKLVFIIVPMIRRTLLNLLILSFIGKMKVFDLVWVMTAGGPLWSTETVSTYVYKRAFEWTTFDLGYPSTIGVMWFVVIMLSALGLTWAFRPREKLEY